MQQLLKLFFGRTARNSAINIGANISFGLLVLLFFALASRSLGPEKFGLISLPIAVFSLSFDFFNLGTSQTLVRYTSIYLGKKQSQQAKRVANTVFRLRLAVSLFLIIISPLLAKLLSSFIFAKPDLSLPLAFAIAAAGGTLMSDFFYSLLQAYEMFFKSAVLLLTSPIIRLILIGWLILNSNPTVLWVTLAFVIAPLLSSIVGFVISPKGFLSLKPNSKTSRELFHFSKWMALWGVTASFIGRIDILLLGSLSSAFETGIYSAASRLASGYIIIGSSFAQVLTPKISRVIDNQAELKRLFKLTVKSVVAISCLMIVFALISGWIVPFIFGSSFAGSVAVFQSLTAALIFFMASIPANVSLLALGHSKWIGGLSLLQLTLLIAVGAIAIPALGAQGAALALMLSYFTTFLLSSFYAFQKILA